MTIKQDHYGKADALQHWEALEDHLPIAVTPISTKHKGSTFAQDAIRITGSKQFIDSVLSNLKGFLDHENDASRIEILYTETLNTDRNKETGTITVTGLSGAWGCYVKVKDRGRGMKGRKAGSKNKQKDDDISEVALHHIDGDETNNDLSNLATVKITQKPDYKAVNAGLAIRDKLREAEKAKNLAIGSADDPRFAIGTPDSEEESGFTWAEPEDSDIPMQTYDDLASCSSRLSNLKKIAAFKKANLVVVEVWKDKKGTLHCNS